MLSDKAVQCRAVDAEFLGRKGQISALLVDRFLEELLLQLFESLFLPFAVAMERTSNGSGFLPPNRRTVPSSKVRSSLACSAGLNSQNSSRKSVPPSAASSSPSLAACAPVKAPRS